MQAKDFIASKINLQVQSTREAVITMQEFKNCCSHESFSRSLLLNELKKTGTVER